jgi:glycosyltransferase involved in cell wall biosynthesis
MTAGPIQIIGGGFNAPESFGRLLGHPSKLIERWALAVIGLFELVVVRGDEAKQFFAAHGIKRTVTVITGSVQNNSKLSRNNRDIHLIFVGRLSPVKQIDQFIMIVDSVRCVVPDVHAVIVGDGPLRADLQRHAEELGLNRNIEFLGKRKDVEPFLSRSKIFVLTSKSEGLSIATCCRGCR